jgi:hypothetical protein
MLTLLRVHFPFPAFLYRPAGRLFEGACGPLAVKAEASDGGAYPRSSALRLCRPARSSRPFGRVIPLAPPSACDGPTPAHCRVASRVHGEPGKQGGQDENRCL